MLLSLRLTEEGQYEIWCQDGRMRAMPAGKRLFKSQPWPDVRFCHDSLAAAESDLTKLRAYLAGLVNKKGPTAKEQREFAA